MPRVSLDQIAPNFSLADYRGNTVSLADFAG
jgi:peroxiredoxin